MTNALFVFGIMELILIIALIVNYDALSEYKLWFTLYGSALIVMSATWIVNVSLGHGGPRFDLKVLLVIGILNLLVAAGLHYLDISPMKSEQDH